jgi:hypothetical protein
LNVSVAEKFKTKIKTPSGYIDWQICISSSFIKRYTQKDTNLEKYMKIKQIWRRKK